MWFKIFSLNPNKTAICQLLKLHRLFQRNRFNSPQNKRRENDKAGVMQEEYDQIQKETLWLVIMQVLNLTQEQLHVKKDKKLAEAFLFQKPNHPVEWLKSQVKYHNKKMPTSTTSHHPITEKRKRMIGTTLKQR